MLGHDLEEVALIYDLEWTERTRGDINWSIIDHNLCLTVAHKGHALTLAFQTFSINFT